MARHQLEYDGHSFTLDDDLSYGVYVQRAGSFRWQVDVKPGIHAKAVLSIDAPTSSIAEMTRRVLVEMIEETLA